MTFYDITNIENGLRAILVEQYENLRNIIPLWTDAMMICCDDDDCGEVNSIVMFEEKKNVSIDCGLMEITRCQPAKGMELNLEAIVENDVLPSMVMTDEIMKSISGISYKFKIYEAKHNIEVIVILDSDAEPDRKVPLIIVEVTSDHERVTREDVFLAIGFVEHTMATGRSMYLLDRYIAQENAKKEARKQSRQRKKAEKEKMKLEKELSEKETSEENPHAKSE